VTAVRDASFVLHENEFVGVVGESGSGKSTLARLIVGLEQPSAGDIVVAGRDVGVGSAEAAAHRRRSVQMVFQDPQSALNPRRRVGSIVTQPLEAADKTTAADRAARALALLTEIGLPPEAVTRFPAQLSGGQRQRVNIARALCAVPRILIADEIVSGLDVSVQAQLINLLADLRRQRGFSMLFISARPVGGALPVRPRAGDVPRRRGQTGPTEQVFAAPALHQGLLAAVPPDPSPRLRGGLG
jgi:peptide/nickel transport system ATP-binding protein